MDYCSISCSTWDFHLAGTVDQASNAVSGTVSFNGVPQPQQSFTSAQRATVLPANYSGTVASFSNSCLVAVGSCPSLGNDTVQATFAVDNNFNVTATLVLSGVDNGTFTLSGPMIGNTMQVSGTVGSQQVEFVAYFDVKGVYGGLPRSLIVFQMPYPTTTVHGTLGYSGTLNPTN